MSPASRSKLKDKKAGKEPEKTPSKPSGFLQSVTGPVSGYNPHLGKFHALEASHISTPLSVNSNGRFRNIDETDDQTAISLGTGLDFDAVSNNGSWSGESEDIKEKTSSHQASRQESVPGADNEKREKIRQKNEKKHQRQKERRAQELHERCSGFLMSRKLEALSQQLVAMGFSSDRATMALILNEGKIEESVNWLFEGVEEEEADRHKESNNLDGGSLKIDITEELAQIAEMEVKYNCSKQEVERAVVAYEGDIEKAAETLRLPKEEVPFAPPKPEETVDDQSKFSVQRIQPRPPSLSINMQQQQPRKEEKNFNYTKAAPAPVPIVAPSIKAGVAKLEWANPQQISTAMEKRWTNGGVGSNPSVSSYPTAPPIQANPSAKVEARYGLLSSELKHLQLGSIKEPVVVMQRPSHQVIINNQKQQQQQQVVSNGNIISSSPPLPPSGGWHQNNNNVGGGMMKSGAFSSSLHNPNPSTRSVSPISLGANKLYSSHIQYQQQQQHHQQQLQQQQQLNMMIDGSNQNQNQNRVNSSWNRNMGASRTLSAASSLGLFSGLGSNSSSSGSSSPIDWTTNSSMFELDYTSVDWSLDRGSRSVGMWGGGGVGGGGGLNSSNNNGYHNNHHNSNNQGGLGGGGGGRAGGAMRQMVSAAAVSNGGISEMGGFKDSGGVVATTAGGEDGGGSSSAVGVGVGVGGGSSREWSSPFEEKDMFSLSRQFVSSPSL